MFTKQSTTYVNSESYTNGNAVTRYGTIHSLHKSRTGFANPKWKSQIANKEPATTAFSGYENNLTINPGFASGRFIDGTPWSSTFLGLNPGVFADNSTVTSSMVDAAVATARSHAFEKIRKLQEPFQGQVFAGELKEAIMLLRNPFQASGRLLEKLSKSNARVAKDIADQYLEFRYAILPLIGDINDIIKNVIDIADIEKHSKFRTYGADHYSQSSYIQNGIGISVVADIEVTLTRSAECFIHFGVLSEYLNRHEEFSSRLIDSFDSLSSVPVTAWNLIPGSFLVDYFVNVNDVLNSAVTSQTSVSYMSESVVKTETYHLTTRNLSVVGGGNVLTIDRFIPRSFTSKSRSVNRTGGQIGIPPIVFTLPGSNTRYANIAALLVSKLLAKG